LHPKEKKNFLAFTLFAGYKISYPSYKTSKLGRIQNSLIRSLAGARVIPTTEKESNERQII
jgi:hypothetical protein